ncbi:Crp/Fnr family transcriptional regulator [Streptomyces sp. NPDC058678]|uniref:Crp/Fnr family transcriptional regulator n=1 Tax=Streptomyces sp. NPDC058678 TaxID=3346595 RepID=UPI00365E922B
MNFCSLVSADVWRDLVERGRRRTFRRGSVLLREGESPDSVIALVEGLVKVTQINECGDELTLTLRGPGEVLGEMGALLGRPLSATVTAVRPCTGFVLPAHAFRGYIERRSLETVVYQLTVERLNTHERLRDTAWNSVVPNCKRSWQPTSPALPRAGSTTMAAPTLSESAVRAVIETVLRDARETGHRPTIAAVERHLGVTHATFYRNFSHLISWFKQQAKPTDGSAPGEAELAHKKSPQSVIADLRRETFNSAALWRSTPKPSVN